MYILGILCNNMQKEVALDIMGISYQIRNCLGGGGVIPVFKNSMRVWAC